MTKTTRQVHNIQMQGEQLVYLASPYSSTDHALLESRYLAAVQAQAFLLHQGIYCYSPIVHNHPVASRYLSHMPDCRGFEFWGEFDLMMLRRCTELMVLKIPGWDESRGVATEFNAAREMSMRVRALEKRMLPRGVIRPHLYHEITGLTLSDAARIMVNLKPL